MSERSELLIRYETVSGEGLFATAGLFSDYIESGAIRVNRRRRHQFEVLLFQLRAMTPNPPTGTYEDHLSRRPITWFRASARELLAACDQLVPLLNQLGAKLCRTETTHPPQILWQDEMQVVTRRTRQPERASTADPVTSRHADRRKRQEKRRQRAGRAQVRRMKGASGN